MITCINNNSVLKHLKYIAFCSLFSGCAFVEHNYSPECKTKDGVESCYYKALTVSKTIEDFAGYTLPYGEYVKIGENSSGDEYYANENTFGVKLIPGLFAQESIGMMFTSDKEELCVINIKNFTVCEDIKDFQIGIIKKKALFY
jgi:hypothetical protein